MTDYPLLDRPDERSSESERIIDVIESESYSLVASTKVEVNLARLNKEDLRLGSGPLSSADAWSRLQRAQSAYGMILEPSRVARPHGSPSGAVRSRPSGRSRDVAPMPERKALSVTAAPVVPIWSQNTPAIGRPRAVKASRRGFVMFYRLSWLCLGLLGMVWSFLSGVSLVGAVPLLGPSTALTGLFVLAGLMVTLVVAGRQDDSADVSGR